MAMARLVTAGADVWLNTPHPPLEATGTSGMKAALNGVLSLSVLDGWWIEGHVALNGSFFTAQRMLRSTWSRHTAQTPSANPHRPRRLHLKR